MQLNKLKSFAQQIRRELKERISVRLADASDPNGFFARNNKDAFKQLQEAISAYGEKEVIEKAAYYWFNRLCALRFMDVRGVLSCAVISPAPGSGDPEILSEAKKGIFYDDLSLNEDIRDPVKAFLSGDTQNWPAMPEKKSEVDPEAAAYRLLLLGACNALNRRMPFLFQKAADYTEFLLPPDLLSPHSIVTLIRENISADDCTSVEIIGWLYQYYISEKKDEIFKGFSKNIKATPENIGPATQLFTPEWIVRYLVENSLGRLWMLNHPDSSLIDSMRYYISPDENEAHDFIKINSPEEIKVCDPCCGSGHMLVYAFELLTKIYEEEGYSDYEIPQLILEHNLTGIEIDERAGELAAFALLMKAAELDRNILKQKEILKPEICVMTNEKLDEFVMEHYRKVLGSDLLTEPFFETLTQFEQAKNFGSLITPHLQDAQEIRDLIKAKNMQGDLMLLPAEQSIERILKMSECLSCRYHVVVTNPPYMGARNMNAELAGFLKDKFADFKSDFFSSMIVRCLDLTLEHGEMGFMSPFVWMFLSSYEKFRAFIQKEGTIYSLIQLEYSGFADATVPICTFTLHKHCQDNYRGAYIRLSDFVGPEIQQPKALEAIQNPDCGWLYRAVASNFSKIPGSPIAYWLSDKFLEIFSRCRRLDEICKPAHGSTTGNNNLFLRQWFEVSLSSVGFGMHDAQEAQTSACKWFPYNKGGAYRRWYGNQDFLVNWKNNGYEIKNYKDENGRNRAILENLSKAFLPSVTWSFVSSSYFGTRYQPAGSIFDVAGSSVFPQAEDRPLILGLMCSSVTSSLLSGLNPTLNYQVGDICRLPYPEFNEAQRQEISAVVDKLVAIEKDDWDSQEISWNFKQNPLIAVFDGKSSLEDTLKALQSHYRELIKETQTLEEQNNENFIRLYGLEGEMTPEHPLSQVTLCCNPYYVYSKKTFDIDDELWAMQRADLMRDLISYAVGCMFGRYSLDKEGVILGRRPGETLQDFKDLVGNTDFEIDDDNIIPIVAESGYFTDDICARFQAFLKMVFGEEHLRENLTFITDCLNVKNKRDYDLRTYFNTEFYDDHVRRYKKRPIYWMFQSPKKNFKALIYIHRYRSGLVSRLRRNYLLDYKNKLDLKLAQLEKANESGKGASYKEIERIRKQTVDMQNYDATCLYQLAQDDIAIDLDDGVKVNYPKFGTALAKITGL